MADLYSVITGLEPNQQDILEAELLAKQILEAQFPDIDLREGTGIRDLVLRPAAFILALCKKGSDAYFDQNTLAGATDATPTETIDDLMGNLFLTRKTGTYAVINARLYFARSKSVSLNQDTSFSTDGSILFYPITNAAYPASALTYDSYQNEWYIDVDLQAADTGTDYNLSEGSLLYFTNFDPYFLHAEINYLRESSTDAETNSEFLARASTAISTRNLINKPSITANLGENFNTLLTILSIGAGDADMYRDLVKVQLDPLAARQVETIASNVLTVNVILTNHGFATGQIVHMTGAVPSGYNGSYAITRIDANQFSYTVPSALSTATTLPFAQGSETTLYMHQGGTVDVYCDTDLIYSVEQYTLNSSGSVTLEGPVVSIKRSAVSGGSSADTMPLAPVVPYTSQDGTDRTRFYSTTSGLVDGDIVAVTGISQSFTISSISCLPGQSFVTVYAPGHPILPQGSLITIEGVSPVDYNGNFVAHRLDNNTFTYSVPNRISLAGSGGSMRVVNRGLLLDQYPTGAVFGTVTVTGSYFNVAMPNIWAGITTTGTAVITHEPPFTLTYPEHTSRTDATFLVDMSTSQYKNQLRMPGNPLVPGRHVRIEGSSHALNNQVWKVEEVVDADTVVISSPVHNNFVAGSSPVTATFVNPMKDFGFSTRQEMIVNYGSGHANQTVSLETLSFANVPSVQSYLENSDNRVLCADILARGFDVYLLDIAVTVYNTVAPTTGEVQTLVQNYLDTLSPGSVFVISELVAALTDGGIQNLRTPISVMATLKQKDLFSFNEFPITDVFNPENTMAMYVINSIETSSMAV